MAKLLPLRFHKVELEEHWSQRAAPMTNHILGSIIVEPWQTMETASLLIPFLLDNMRHSILDTVNCLQLSSMTLLEAENKRMNKPMHLSAVTSHLKVQF